MKFLYCENAGASQITLNSEQSAHLKAQRLKLGDKILVRDLINLCAFCYEICEFKRNSAILRLIEIIENSIESKLDSISKKPHSTILWAIIEPKIIERTLPSLNELNLSHIALFYADFSQRNFKIDKERIRKILCASCEQCGRTQLPCVSVFSNLEEALDSMLLTTKNTNGFNILQNPNISVVPLNKKQIFALDTKEDSIKSKLIESSAKIENFNAAIIGAEGGFSENERAFLKEQKITKKQINNAWILRSQTAAIYAASFLLQMPQKT